MKIFKFSYERMEQIREGLAQQNLTITQDIPGLGYYVLYEQGASASNGDYPVGSLQIKATGEVKVILRDAWVIGFEVFMGVKGESNDSGL